MPHYYENDPPSPNPYPIPSDYSSLGEALERAIGKWGQRDGRSKLLGLLAIGQLTWWKSSYKELRKGETSFWGNLPSKALDRIFREERFGESPRGFVRTWERPDGWRPVFLTKDLDQQLRFNNEVGVEKQAVPSVAPKKMRRGRPPNANIDDFWIEAARLAYTAEQGAANQTQESFIAAMRSWSQANGEPYAEDTIADKIKRLWRTLKLGQK